MFHHRSLTTQDFDRAFSLLRERFVFDDTDRSRLVSLWTELLSTQACRTVGVDDRRRPPETRLVGFGMSVFATDDFTRQILEGRPFLSRALLEEWEAGRRPFLTTKEVAAGNAGDGLNLVVLHYGWCKDLSPDDMAAIQIRQTERFMHEHAGYLTKEYVQEVFGSVLRDFMVAGGMVVKQDYREDMWCDALAGVPEDDRPYLTAHGSEASRAGTLASIFRSKGTRPRFGLSPGEQRMLLLALEGQSDEDLAVTLDLSSWTVKKRWQNIYAKVDAVDPNIVTPHRDDKLRQRRRYLFAHLREHLEELRPYRRR